MTDTNSYSWPWPASALSGALGAVLTTLGIPAGMLVVSACGCYIGMAFAKPMGRWRALSVFMGTSIICAKIGLVSGAVVVLKFPALATVGDIPGVISAALGLLFHPILGALVQRVPDIISKRIS